MPRRDPALVAPFALPLFACATNPHVAGVPRTVEQRVIAPYAQHEDCLQLAAGARLEWRYESSAPLAFDIRYYEANAVLAPIVREHSLADNGVFEAAADRRYCLVWEAGAAGAIIGYRMLVRTTR